MEDFATVVPLLTGKENQLRTRKQIKGAADELDIIGLTACIQKPHLYIYTKYFGHFTNVNVKGEN